MSSEVRKDACDNCFKETPCLCIKECQGDSWYSDDESVLCEKCIEEMFNDKCNQGAQRGEEMKEKINSEIKDGTGMEEENLVDGLKTEINELLFTRVVGETTVAQLEKLSVKIFDIITDHNNQPKALSEGKG